MYMHDVSTSTNAVWWRMDERCACTMVAKAHRALFRFYEQEMLGSGLTITQFAIGRALQRNGPTPLSALAAELVMDRTSLYRTIRPMVDGRWVRIVEAPRGRAKVASLTARGRRALAAAEPSWARVQRSAVAAIGSKDFAALARALTRVPEALEATRNSR